MSQRRIVLVRPRDPNNIGAVARAMKNFGFNDLWVVAPYPPVWSEVVSAVNAFDVLTGAQVVETLDEAIADCNLVVGAADRTRIERKQSVYTPINLSDDLAQESYDLAIIFGSEKHGLTNDDLSRCHRIMSIPTEADCPSMNLGQAAAVCCYELAKARAQSAIEPPPSESASAGAVEAALQLSLDVLRSIDFVLTGNEPELTRKLRSSFLRFNMTKSDVEMLCGVLSRVKRELEN
jgi:tRNA/rRNA methyltransferase